MCQWSYKQAYTLYMELAFASWCFYPTFISAISKHSNGWKSCSYLVSFPHLPKPRSLTYLWVWLSLNAVQMMSDSCIGCLNSAGEEMSCVKNMMCGLQASGIYFDKIYYHHKLWIICVFDHIQRRLKASVFVHANLFKLSFSYWVFFFFFYFLFIFPSSFYLCHILSCYPSPTL